METEAHISDLDRGTKLDWNLGLQSSVRPVGWPYQCAGLDACPLCFLQATLFDPQLHDGACICERVASIVDGEPEVGGGQGLGRLG